MSHVVSSWELVTDSKGPDHTARICRLVRVIAVHIYPVVSLAFLGGAQVAQWVKHLPAYLAFHVSILLEADLFNSKQGSIRHPFGSPEHKVLMVTYCDQSMSVVSRQQFALKANSS